MKGELIYALSPNRHKPLFNKPFSNLLYNALPSNARQSDVDPGKTMDISRNFPRASATAWQFKPNFSFLPQRNFIASQPLFLQSCIEGHLIQIKIPSIAPAQQLKPAELMALKPSATFCCSSSDSGYFMTNSGCMFTAFTTVQTLS
jgi:hypothetical protein